MHNYYLQDDIYVLIIQFDLLWCLINKKKNLITKNPHQKPKTYLPQKFTSHWYRRDSQNIHSIQTHFHKKLFKVYVRRRHGTGSVASTSPWDGACDGTHRRPNGEGASSRQGALPSLLLSLTASLLKLCMPRTLPNFFVISI